MRENPKPVRNYTYAILRAALYLICFPTMRMRKTYQCLGILLELKHFQRT